LDTPVPGFYRRKLREFEQKAAKVAKFGYRLWNRPKLRSGVIVPAAIRAGHHQTKRPDSRRRKYEKVTPANESQNVLMLNLKS
jgi:hypothetical protein